MKLSKTLIAITVVSALSGCQATKIAHKMENGTPSNRQLSFKIEHKENLLDGHYSNVSFVMPKGEAKFICGNTFKEELSPEVKFNFARYKKYSYSKSARYIVSASTFLPKNCKPSKETITLVTNKVNTELQAQYDEREAKRLAKAEKARLDRIERENREKAQAKAREDAERKRKAYLNSHLFKIDEVADSVAVVKVCADNLYYFNPISEKLANRKQIKETKKSLGKQWNQSRFDDRMKSTYNYLTMSLSTQVYNAEFVRGCKVVNAAFKMK